MRKEVIIFEGWNCKRVMQDAREYPGSCEIMCNGQVRKNGICVTYVYYRNPNNVTDYTYLVADCNKSSTVEKELNRTISGYKSDKEIKDIVTRAILDETE